MGHGFQMKFYLLAPTYLYKVRMRSTILCILLDVGGQLAARLGAQIWCNVLTGFFYTYA